MSDVASEIVSPLISIRSPDAQENAQQGLRHREEHRGRPSDVNPSEREVRTYRWSCGPNETVVAERAWLYISARARPEAKPHTPCSCMTQYAQNLVVRWQKSRDPAPTTRRAAPPWVAFTASS